MIKKHIPNFITLLNLLSGCIAIVLIFHKNIYLASCFIGFSFVLDFLDGMLARLLNVKSEIGKQLDSLADLVSFGLVPGFILFHLINENNEMEYFIISNISFISFFAFLIPMFSALRLAKFNIDESQALSFKGLPTPANAILIASFPLIIKFHSDFDCIVNLLQNIWFLVGIVLIQSFLLVSNISLMALKFTDFSWKNNYLKFILILVSIILIILFKFIAIPIIILFYILLSFFSKNR